MADGDDPVALRKQRAVIKGSCTRIRTYIESIVAITPSIVANIEERKLKLDQYWSEYNVLQTRLEILDDAESNDRAPFEEAFYALSAKMRELLNPIQASRNLTFSPSTSIAQGSDAPASVRLPKINLPTFSGKYEEWFPFFDSFHSIIHSNASINRVQKFQYLKGCLTGEASVVIDSIEISDANYEVAWDTLKERYDDKYALVQNHIKAIIEMPSIIKANSTELRQMADHLGKHLRTLRALEIPVDHWDHILVYILSSKFDPATSREWRSSLKDKGHLPTLKELLKFIAHQCRTLEGAPQSSSESAKKAESKSHSNPKRQASCVATVKMKCNYCQGDHSIYYCKTFVALPVPRRISEIRNRKLCGNCLRTTSHAPGKCTSGHCKICHAKHNTLLHLETATESANQSTNKNKIQDSTSSSVLATHASSSFKNGQIILSTASLYAFDKEGKRRPCRALLDCGSQANFILQEFLTTLGIKPTASNISISGIHGTVTRSRQVTQVKLQSRIGTYAASIQCIVADRVTDKIPAHSFKRNAFELPRNIQLADPQFHVSAEIDLLIGAELFWDLLCVGQVRSSNKHPTLQKTRLGWILAGRLNNHTPPPARVHSFYTSISNDQLHDQVGKFWQLDHSLDDPTSRTLEEDQCEQHFLSNVSQTSQGRYVVKLPVKEHILSKLGDSHAAALKRFKGLERRLARDPCLKSQYSQFLDEYLFLGHMRQVNSRPDVSSTSFYLPHHCVFKQSGQLSKLRIVFDASCRSSTGISLNDALMVGPVVQQDLISILLRFRFFQFVISADIIKMYRQVLLDPSQTCLQRILWRDDPTSEVSTYELLTVTYGTASASYLATRCLVYLADQHASQFPVGSIRVRRDFYVDDLLTGADTPEELELICDEIIQLLRLGSFELSKWASNCPALLEAVTHRDSELVTINKDESNSRVLGVRWSQSCDTFQFFYELDSKDEVSKRTILSEVARLFDPLGLLGPVIVIAKILLQDLWQSGVQWDESIPQEIHTRWLKLKSQLSTLNQLRVSRCVKFHADGQNLQIHGFCDASQQAYGACIYIRTRIGHGSYRCELLCSKSQVAPLKSVSLPRLELSAALLLARLIDKVRESLNASNLQTYLWSDSTIALNWIVSASRRWSVFVANRVGEIQRLTDIKQWRHIESSNNPADPLSRGLFPQALADTDLWWHGPAFLLAEEELWPNSDFTHFKDDIPEQKRIVATATVCDTYIVDDLLTKISNLDKISRIIAYCLRFHRSRRPDTFNEIISPGEMSSSLEAICKVVQSKVFPKEYQALSKGDNINPSSSLLSLSPFMDDSGLIRVGGRLKNSGLQFDACHPILLPRNHALTQKIILQEHARNLHAGLQATMAAVRQRFWPLSLRSAARKLLQGCVICFKAKPRHSETLMGPLPAGRVTVSRPFSHCGVDYAGPLILREGKRRNARNHKAYVSIFVCFATKAVHLELVSDLTSDAFIAALKRFISRRGKPSQMYSDNGTTFVGAQKQIQELYDVYNKQSTQSEIRQFLCNQAILWSFIPPNAPHFGGLWEAAVKSAKYHLVRIIGKAHLMFEEMQTALCEIEAILNSRPLTSLSADLNDLAYLTPGHFLVGSALNSFPSTDLTDVSENRLVRWQRVEQIRQHFWRRWSLEYLHLLQERSKWKTNKGTQLKTNQVVLIKQQNLAPLQWTLGRIQDIHPGSDGIARTATVKTAKGTYVRPLSKLAILPLEA